MLQLESQGREGADTGLSPLPEDGLGSADLGPTIFAVSVNCEAEFQGSVCQGPSAFWMWHLCPLVPPSAVSHSVCYVTCTGGPSLKDQNSSCTPLLS